MPRLHFGLLLLLPLALALGCESESIVGSARDAGIDAPVALDVPIDVQAKPRDTVTDVSRCSTGQRECNGLCVSVAIDPANCGACGTRCADTERRLVSPVASCMLVRVLAPFRHTFSG
jgi:hypothetical protein